MLLPAGESRLLAVAGFFFWGGAFSTPEVVVPLGPSAPECCPCLQAKDAGQRTTIYKRDPSKQYGLKMKTSRAFFSEVERRFDTMPFTLRYLLRLVASPSLLAASRPCLQQPPPACPLPGATLHWGLCWLNRGWVSEGY